MAILAYALTFVCPAWCALPAGHAPEHVDEFDGSQIIVHRAPVLADDPTGRRLDLAQSVTVERDGSVQEEQPVVVVDGSADNTLSGEQARRQAAALTLAADVLAGGATAGEDDDPLEALADAVGVFVDRVEQPVQLAVIAGGAR